MYKVLIVDDEVLVRIGLKNTIDWESIGFTVVGEASNGEQGYAQFLKLDPDVVITDIKMPKKDGLWLTEKIKKDKRQTKILVLTCYDEFQYARNALKSGASDYILKSEIVDEELITLMKGLKASLDEEGLVGEAQAPKKINQNAIKRALLNDLIRVKFTLDERLTLRIKEQNFDFENMKFAFVYIENKLQEKSKKKQISETTVNLIVDQLNERGIAYLFNGYVDEHLFLVASPELSLTLLSRISSTIQNGVSQYFDASINIIYTNVIVHFDEVSSSYITFLERVEMLYYTPYDISLVENVDHIKIINFNTQNLKIKYETELIEKIGQEDIASVLSCFDEIFNTFKEKHYMPKSLKLIIVQIFSELYNSFQYVFDASEISFNYEHFHETIFTTTHISELKLITSNLVQLIIHELKYIRQNQSKFLIKRAINFIDHNYDQNISLEDVAKVINLSKQYVCNIFKKETGQNLSHYINQVRIEKAKVLLMNPANSNKDVYAMVGYSNQQYFSRVFKKVTGMTTSSYKEQYLKNRD